MRPHNTITQMSSKDFSTLARTNERDQSRPLNPGTVQHGTSNYKTRPARPALSPFNRSSTIVCTRASRLLTTTSRESRRLDREPTSGLRMLSVVAVCFTRQPCTVWSKTGGILTQAQISDKSLGDGVDLSQESSEESLQASSLTTSELAGTRCECLGLSCGGVDCAHHQRDLG